MAEQCHQYNKSNFLFFCHIKLVFVYFWRWFRIEFTLLLSVGCDFFFYWGIVHCLCFVSNSSKNHCQSHAIKQSRTLSNVSCRFAHGFGFTKRHHMWTVVFVPCQNLFTLTFQWLLGCRHRRCCCHSFRNGIQTRIYIFACCYRNNNSELRWWIPRK